MVRDINLKISPIKTALVFFSILLSACANKPAKSLDSYQFLTRISDSGLKHFELREKRLKQRTPPASANRPIGGATIITKSDFKRKRKALQKVARELLEEKQYCKQGFWVLEADIDFRGPFIRGECNDLATAEDRQQFADTLANW